MLYAYKRNSYKLTIFCINAETQNDDFIGTGSVDSEPLSPYCRMLLQSKIHSDISEKNKQSSLERVWTSAIGNE
jgi:hypothetical protein